MSAPDLELLVWEESASQWAQHADRIASITAEVTAALIARLQPRPGQRLLDVAAGPGDPSLRLAELVGPEGDVVATDGVRSMLDALQNRARERGLRNVTVLHSAAEDLALPEASFDAACCRFGVMFFSDPVRALHNVRRAVRRGGRGVLAAWGARAANPFFTLGMETLDEVGAPELAPAGARTVFEYEEPRKLCGILAAAGWCEVREDREALHMTLSDTAPDTLMDALVEVSRRMAERLRALDPAARERARSLLAQRAAPYARGADLVFPCEVLFVGGQV